MSIRRALPVLAVLAIVALLAGDVLACPNCKEAVAAQNPGGAQGASVGGDAASGFNNAIYLSLGAVFSILGVFGFRVARAVRRADSAMN